MKKPCTGNRGFTLIELLVSSAILVILGVAGYVGLDVILGTAERTGAQTERLHQVQRSFTQMAMDFEQAADHLNGISCNIAGSF